MISREEFESYVAGLISEEEKKRLNKKVLVFTILSVISLFTAMLFVFLVITSTTVNTTFIILAVFFAFLALLLMLSRKSGAFSKLESKYKVQVLDYLLQDMPHEYDKNSRVPEKIFKEARITSLYDDYSGEDLLIINIPDDDGSATSSNLVISDVLATRQEYDENDETWKTVTKYRGVLGYIRFPFEFKCRLTINRNDYAYMEGLDKVELESIEFNKKFKIRSSDQLESRYILTPDMMMKLLAMFDKEKRIQLVLDGDTMYITIPNKNLFSLSTRSKKIDGTVFYNLYEDISLLLSIIGEIRNNDKIFKM